MVKKFLQGILTFLGVIFLFFIIVFFIGILLLLRGEPTLSTGPKIGIVEIKGLITDADKTLRVIRNYERNDHVKAVVVRIDSPGGAVGASQEIYLALKELAQKKTVVASMGSVAASGGLYVALGAQKIVAAPGTMTGSIGVMIQVPNVSKLLEKVGIETTILKSGPYKDTGSMFRPLREDEKKVLYQTIKDVYQQFVEAIATSRGLNPEEIKKFADGRVFTGKKAKEYGLVDELGNFNDAIYLAAKLAGIKERPQLVYLQKERFWWRYLFEENLAENLAVIFAPLYLLKWQ
ncbi:signal peptide peptidase SppA [Thermodesulfatator atlanticus]|uniref:signal peptide peptidase SppA n=1 Tax=Thermodesulfatator atlanticus TaxID=501497 RepID=UPI0003B3F6E3|nr:signal peptide peptidase SppA [Thermodesulfatator atlanticus]